MFESPILILKFDEFLLISFEDIDLVMKMANEYILLVGFYFDGRVEVGRSFGCRHGVYY